VKLSFLRAAHAPRRRVRLLAVAALSSSVAAASCSDSPVAPAAPDTSPELLPGEVCDADNRPDLRLTFDPPNVVVAPGERRAVRLTIEPDACVPADATFATADAAIAAAPATGRFDLRHPTYDFVVTGGGLGRTTIKASMGAKTANGEPYTVDAELPVDVRDRAAPTCAAGDVAQGTVSGAAPTLAGTGALANSRLAAPPAAFTRDDELALPSFPASIACEPADLIGALPDAKLRKLGPAVTFAAGAPLSMAKSLRREVEVTLPVNPAAFPTDARLRHLVVLYKGPRIKTPRPITIANPRIDAEGDDYVLRFQTPWFGTYQAAVAEDAGAVKTKRRLSHRAVIGISMGGGGAAVYGMRHHDKFDALGPLGGPSDWTWMLWYIEQNALGGFCPVGKTCPKVAPNLYPMEETYAHTMDYDHWFYERGKGNGGSFPRSEYVQIFEDLALAMGNPNGSGSDPSLLHVALGPKASDPWIKGDPALGLPPNVDCSFTVDPVRVESPADEATNARQREIQDRCNAFRCDPKNAWKAPANYFDDEYNPDGTLPVISFCDGGQKPDAPSPYVNTWAPGGQKPMNLGLAVDLNNNGIRDEGEPIIRAGHEPFDDCGPDGLCDAQEPGYDPQTNPDPNQDDYDFQLNPGGLEGNHRWDPGEPYKDVGLDGVPNTALRHVAGDPGEGDGKYTESVGLSNFYANDPHGIVSGRVKDIPGGEMTDAALRRIDVLSDGGVRDLFNFAAVANHLTGQIAGRRGPNGLPLRSVAYYNGFHHLPGEPSDPSFFDPALIRWADVAAIPNIRYGDVDAPRSVVEQTGDGQHVGTATQILNRLQMSFFYVGRRWPDADRVQTKETSDDPATSTINELGLECELSGKCQKIFTGKRTGRTGPISVSLPPGYAHKENVARNVRYPVLYVLHGYGQDPRDLEAVAIFTNNYMNPPQRSSATRLPKFIIVYVDGRCRVRPDGKPECIRGTFYMNSARPDGAKLDEWFDEVTEYVDQNYRTMPATEVEVAE